MAQNLHDVHAGDLFKLKESDDEIPSGAIMRVILVKERYFAYPIVCECISHAVVPNDPFTQRLVFDRDELIKVKRISSRIVSMIVAYELKRDR